MCIKLVSYPAPSQDYLPPAYEHLSASQPDVLLRGAPVVGLGTDSRTLDRLLADDIHEVKLTVLIIIV